MGSYKIRLFPIAEKEFRAAPFPFRRQINQRIMLLKEEPFPDDAELISETERHRLPVHGWHVIYEVDEIRRRVTVWSVAKD